jgi:shikimate dehydrogenase
MLEDFCRRELGGRAGEVLRGREAIVLGSGGASHAVVPVLRDAGARVGVISRTGGDTYETLLERHGDAALVVNTTPVGTFPNCPASPLASGTLERMRSLAGVLDVVYNPERTGICLEAEQLGIPSQSGLGMLVSQAYFASQLFQGRSLPRRLVDDICEDIAHKSRNIALIGMPGVGKTTTGRQLARIENRPFVDLDDAFELAHGMSAAACIESRGEEEFRRLETEVCADWCSRSGLVVSCGGGIVTRPENYALLHQNATIVMLDRPIDQLSSKGRPLSQGRGVEELARTRMGLYQKWSDLQIQCTGSPQGDARAILSALGRPLA